MEIYQRNIHSEVKIEDNDKMLVSSSLLDLDHSFHLEMTVCLSTEIIQSAGAVIGKAPFGVCRQAASLASNLKGLKIKRGIAKQIGGRLGGSGGCPHMVELAIDAVRLTSMILIGKSVGYWSEAKQGKTEEEAIAAGKGKLANSCIVFSDPK